MGELLDYMEAYALLKRYHIKSVESTYVKSAEDAISFSGGDAIVLKVLSQKALHKSKSGLVELNLATEKEIRSAFSRLERKAGALKPYNILAQKMLGKGLEIIIGGNTDQQFGKLVLIGLGGIYVETFKDFALRICPISRYDATSMLEQLKSKSIIAGDAKAESMVIELLMNASRMFYENDITELDLNPVILHDGTYDAVDLRLLR
ncbi:MAG: acetate--CoA ligase family protein [Candidatus Marsarchaeota archaeon]|jgi:succinyl-CoA synthetase beta subunit|nr:acetate--CoA ligase family protein [Candidatus Marsarchaeota archaeon]MCL5418896.1 acetate--CoA ligase family protein [Candidatus Marsarchaeota archaeon]